MILRESDFPVSYWLKWLWSEKEKEKMKANNSSDNNSLREAKADDRERTPATVHAAFCRRKRKSTVILAVSYDFLLPFPGVGTMEKERVINEIWKLKERADKNFPIWTAPFCHWFRYSSVPDHAMPSRASPEKMLPSKPGTYSHYAPMASGCFSCTTPKA